jgi:hypothetical protein
MYNSGATCTHFRSNKIQPRQLGSEHFLTLCGGQQAGAFEHCRCLILFGTNSQSSYTFCT